jgi:tripartite-type tricarboxylate transporter receptor subunit TctC
LNPSLSCSFIAGAFACTFVAGAPFALAQTYPAKSVRLIVPVAPGGGTDIVARLVAQGLSERWGQSVVVDNHGGGGGVIGVSLVAKAAPDGYTMLLGSNGHVTFAPALYRNLPYDTQKDLAPISLVANQPFVLAVHPSLPVRSVQELIALAKKNPGLITYASGGSGGASHLGTELLQITTGISLVHVPYKGTGPGMTALLSGEVQIAIVGVATILPHMATGKVRALAVTGAKRSQAAPDLPTIAEAGVAGYEFDVWYGLLFTGGTPREIVMKTNAEINRILKSPATAERFTSAGLEPVATTPEEFAAMIKSEIPKWQKVVKAAGLKAD